MINTVDEAISQIRHIQLDSEHSPEQILRMILAGGASQSLFNIGRGIHQPALEFLCRETRAIPHYPVPGGIVRDDEKGRPYFSAGTKKFRANEHQNEFLGTLAASGIYFGTPVTTEQGREFTLADLAVTAMQTYSDSTEEPGWSLMLFSIHPGVTLDWTNERGEIWNTERILRCACRLPFGAGSCFGTHVIEGVAFAVSRYCLEQDCEPNQLEGVWLEAYDYVIRAARWMGKNQKDDGSIPRSWFREKTLPRNTNELRETVKDIVWRRFRPAKAIVYPTGHCLDALSPLSMFLVPAHPWIHAACYITADTIQSQWPRVGSELCAVTHAVHALKLLGT